jgi:hypothetical protein
MEQGGSGEWGWPDEVFSGHRRMLPELSETRKKPKNCPADPLTDLLTGEQPLADR